jgi:hypothetical protein
MWCIGLIVARCFVAEPAPAASGATFCQVAKPMYWSASDSRRTKEQADIHNRKGKRLCGWGSPR